MSRRVITKSVVSQKGHTNTKWVMINYHDCGNNCVECLVEGAADQDFLDAGDMDTSHNIMLATGGVAVNFADVEDLLIASGSGTILEGGTIE